MLLLLNYKPGKLNDNIVGAKFFCTVTINFPLGISVSDIGIFFSLAARIYSLTKLLWAGQIVNRSFNL